MKVDKVHFWGEQDGVPERELKLKLSALFHSLGIVQRAYLAKVSFENGLTTSVGLCIIATRVHQEDIVVNVKEVFATLFDSHEHLDIVFLDSHQEDALARVCHPFFPLTI
jgi:2,3-bisphosphoglycerate-independent phosphoglycerate mutase